MRSDGKDLLYTTPRSEVAGLQLQHSSAVDGEVDAVKGNGGQGLRAEGI